MTGGCAAARVECRRSRFAYENRLNNVIRSRCHPAVRRVETTGKTAATVDATACLHCLLLQRLRRSPLSFVLFPGSCASSATKPTESVYRNTVMGRPAALDAKCAAIAHLWRPRSSVTKLEISARVRGSRNLFKF